MESAPNPNLIYDLFGGIFKPQFIRIAILLDVFTPLASNPATAHQVAGDCHCGTAGIQALLDHLCDLQILERHGDAYALTHTAETFLVRGRKSYVGDMILDYTDAALYASVLNSIRTGQPHSLNENFVQDAWLESYSPTRIAKSLEMWRAAGIPPEGQNTIQILDIACGCAIKSFALAQVVSDVRVTCLDSADVLAVARDLATRMAVTSQVTFCPADLFTADLGITQFDSVLVGQITHYLTPAQNQDLFRRIHSTLKQNGTMVIDCPMSQAMPSEFISFLTLFLWTNSGGTAYSFETYKSWLDEIGFCPVTQLSERWLATHK